MFTYPAPGVSARSPDLPATGPERNIDSLAQTIPAALPSCRKAVQPRADTRRTRETQVAAPTQMQSPEARGPALAKCSSDDLFRECRGGEALAQTCWTFHPFDQRRYANEPAISGRPLCAGWVREAMRRVDRNDRAQPFSLVNVAYQMRTDATRQRRGVAAEQFGRVVAFQFNPSSLGLRGLRLSSSERFSSPVRAQNIDALVTSLHEMRENQLAFLRLALTSRQSADGEYGHAVLIQRLAHGAYAIFDPNNGAFEYRSRADMEDALRNYMDESFNEPGQGFDVTPSSIQYFGASASQLGEEPLPVSTPFREPRLDLQQGMPSTREIYHASADQSNELSTDVLSAAAGRTRRGLAWPQALAYQAMLYIAQGAAPDLTVATESVRARLADPAQRSGFVHVLGQLGEANRYGVLSDMPNRTRRPGSFGIDDAPTLQEDLWTNFHNTRDPEDRRHAFRNDFAELRLTFRNPPASSAQGAAIAAGEAVDQYSIVVQRRGTSANFEEDGYDLYEPEIGVFRYSNFAELTQALQGVMARGYPERGGIRRVDTVYFGHYDDEPPAPHHVPTTPAPHVARAANMSLAAVEPLLGIGGRPSQTPPLANLGHEPDFGFEEPPAALPGSSRVDLKRSTTDLDTDRPFALYRPSKVTPTELAMTGAFASDGTLLRNVNLGMHDFDVASNPHQVDSAGYLGTFRSENAAAARLPADVQLGFIYAVAPTPNMVDVNESLGSRAHDPKSAEVAAMGRIDYTQIRGWRIVMNGVVGKFIHNRDYRWDIYNQTRIAHPQPLLARFPVESDAGPFVTSDPNGEGKRFNQDPNLYQAQFYDNAWGKVRNLQARQAAGLDYRGPMTVEAYGGNDTRGTHLYIDASGSPVVNSKHKASSLDAASRHNFLMGEDGRLHLADNYRKVLRVNAQGNVYLGEVPSSGNNRNGVFEYTSSRLFHREDGKFLTVGVVSETPYVAAAPAGSRSAWSLRRPDQRPAQPPKNSENTFWGLMAGRRRLYRFEADPDSALPKNATHFVTLIPGNAYSGNFLDYVGWMSGQDITAASRWLREHDAAWLFKDGFYVTAREGAGQYLEARSLDGVLRWWTDLDPMTGNIRRHSASLASDYRVGDDVWYTVKEKEQRREQLFRALE
jgi:hypothetical protein